MNSTLLNTSALLTHIQTHAQPLRLPRAGVLLWDDAEAHAAACQRDPALYALLALAPGAQPWQRARILLQVLRSSWAGLDADTHSVLERVCAALLLGLPPGHVLTVLLALRRMRANHKHVSRAAVSFLLDHPQAEALAQLRRPTLRDCFEHALGKSTARTCARMLLGEREADPAYLQRHLLRFSTAPQTAAERVRALYSPAPAERPAVSALAPALQLERRSQRPEQVTATNRGDIAATLVHLYRGGPNEQLRRELDIYVELETEGLPRFGGTLALVLDASASMQGYGGRQYALLSQSVALRQVLERCCARLEVLPVGGDGPQPQPQGATDLAGALLDALELRPDLVAIVSDGYENVYPGDLARVVASLPRCGVSTPVLFCHSTFTDRDDLELRRPTAALPQRLFWHQEDFGGLLLWMFAHAEPALAEPWVRGALAARLAHLETWGRTGPSPAAASLS